MSVPTSAPRRDHRATRRRWLVRVMLALAAVLTLVLSGPRTTVRVPDSARAAAEVPDDLPSLGRWVSRREVEAGVRDTFVAARLRFAGDTVRTPYSVVYLHGFSGSRQETSPVPERVATALGANLFEARLQGHGLPSDSMGSITAHALLADAVRALTIGARLGDSVIVIGLSTGATLAAWLAAAPRELSGPVHAVVLMSPNFGPRAPIAKALLLPWARVILPRLIPEVVIDDTPPANDEIARMGSARIPMRAVFPMQAIVARVVAAPLDGYRAPTLALYHVDDPVVDARATDALLDRLAAAGAHVSRERVTPEPTERPHVLAGRLLSPSKVDPVVQRIVRFVRGGSGA